MITIDIDWIRLPNGVIISSDDQLKKTLSRMRSCVDADVSYRVSASGNGFHIKCDCRGCDQCRMVFDSPVRWDMDQTRPPETREVLWDSKVYRKGGSRVALKSGEWVEC